jgi:hypothetical protein
MMRNISRTQLTAGWAGAVVALLACTVVAGAELTFSTAQLWFVAGVVPPAVMLLLWHPAPQLTAAEVLHSASRQPAGRR